MYFGKVAVIRRKRVVDETGTHYPIKTFTVVVPVPEGREIFVVPVSEDMANRLKGLGLRKGVPIRISGEVKPVKDEYGTLYYIMNSNWFETIKKQKGRKVWKSRL